MNEPILEVSLTTRSNPVFDVFDYGSYQIFGMVVRQTTFSGENLVLRGQSAPWVIDAAKKLEAIGRLQTGWDSYGGQMLDPEAKRLTVNTLGWLDGVDLPVPAVVLGSAGTVQLEWHRDGRELEVELGKGGIEFLQISPNSNPVEGTNESGIPEKLQELTWWLLHGV